MHGASQAIACPKCKAQWQIVLEREDDFHGPIDDRVGYGSRDGGVGFVARLERAMCPNCGAKVESIPEETPPAIEKIGW